MGIGEPKEGITIERVLILSMGFGTGHNAAAKALEKSFNKYPLVQATTVDLLELIPRSFHPLLQSGYHGMLNKFPTFYHYLYDWTHHHKVFRYLSSEAIEKMGWMIRKKLNQVFQEVCPTRVVVTHAFALLLLRSSKWAEIPTVGVLTDYELHPIWLVRPPQVLCVPKKLINQHELDRVRWKTGLKIVESGIPVHPDFYNHALSKKEARQALGLDVHLPVVLIMGGGTGIGPLEQLVEEIKGLSHIQWVVLTGENEQLYQRLRKKYIGYSIRIESFRCDIPLWMAAADLLVTKPGGLTISEAIAKKLPMLLFEAFLGQEEANQLYLLHHRVAMITKPSVIREQVQQIFTPGFNLDIFKDRFAPLMSPQASEKIVKATLTAHNPIVQMV